MKKIIVLLFVSLMLFSGCTKKETTDDKSSLQEEINPFDLSGEDMSNVIASFSFGVDEISETKSIMDYNGGELQFNCSLSNSEIPCEVGIIIFIDGYSQAFTTDEKTEENVVQAYSLKENENKTVKVKFTPDIGKKGDKLNVSIGTILFPSFKPNKDTKTLLPNIQYGASLPWDLNILADGKNKDISIDNKSTFKPITEDYKNKHYNHDENNKIVEPSTLNAININLTVPEDEPKLDISNGKQVIKLEATCCDNYTYRVSFFNCVFAHFWTIFRLTHTIASLSFQAIM